MRPAVRKSACKSRVIGIAGCAVSLGVAALGPAIAEDSGFWQAVLPARESIRAVAPAPGFSIVLPPALRIERPRPQMARLPSPESPSVAIPPKPPDPSKRENPLAALLRDSTLRYGDMVMFPDGPRVFKGEPGSRHSVHDFVAVSKLRDVPQATRKMLLAMPVGDNNAWSSDVIARTGQLARRSADVETTGSTGKAVGKTVTVRTGRGDVRVIRVPD